MGITFSWFKYGLKEKKRAFFENSLRQIETILGVESVAMNGILPLSDMVNTSTQSQGYFIAEGQSNVEQSENSLISIQRVTLNYFEVMGIGMKHGTIFDRSGHSSHGYQVMLIRGEPCRYFNLQPRCDCASFRITPGNLSPFSKGFVRQSCQCFKKRLDCVYDVVYIRDQ